MYNLTDFENFIYACEGMLVNAGFDIIEWKPHFKKELWEKNSFIANGKMKTAQKVWQVKQKQINEHAHHSKTNIKHLILVKKNQEVKTHVKSELLRVNEMYEAFADKHKLNNSDALINNEWFFAIRDLIIDLTQWFEGFTYRQANKETRYRITLFDEDNSRNFHEYQFIERQIKQAGYFKVDEAKIYTPELSYFLTSKAFSVLNLDEDKEEKINCLNYLNTYLDAFKKGEEYFDNEFKVNPSTLYGSNAEHYVKDIHQNYFHVKHAGLQSGWVFVKNTFPCIITHKEIDKYGYYSGIVSKVDKQVRKYTQLFANFDKCEHNQEGNAGEDEKNKIPAKYYALYHWILIKTGKEKGFERNENDKFIKTEIELFCKNRHPLISAQGFYRAFIGIDITNKTLIANSFGKGYKEKLIKISNNDIDIIKHLKEYPN